MILAIIQARMASTRLPGKVLQPLAGAPMVVRMVERVRRARKLDDIIVATSIDPSDDPLVTTCAKNDITCTRGSLNDVLDRYYQAAATCHPERVVRLTCDCPLIDPGVIDDAVTFAVTGEFDYASNTLEPTFPDGLDVEIMTFAALETAWREARLPSDREHVTPYIKKSPRFRRGNLRNATNLSALRWTVDEAADLAAVRLIYDALLPQSPDFRMDDILRFLDANPQVTTLNAHIGRDDGYARSLKNDPVLPSE
jgi:spore coat polysaccharide biosynthesis protein SpsF